MIELTPKVIIFITAVIVYVLLMIYAIRNAGIVDPNDEDF
jgi:ABC-type antimicrobial peptide transport system permease subunit